MTEYISDSDDGKLCQTKNLKGNPVLVIMNVDEFRCNKDKFACYKEILRGLGSIRYCKAEYYRNCIYGTMRIPRKSEERAPHVTFAFYINENTLYLIEDTGDIKRWVEKHADRLGKMQSPDRLMLDIMTQLVENDTLYLSHLEKVLEDIEDELNNNISEEIFAKITRFRQKISEINAYYSQLTEIGDMMQSHICDSVIHNSDEWNRYSRGTDRLQNHVRLLRENVIQLRELYQSRQDERQNKVMCMLTVVTTLFLPLTLLTGWYGMNFVHMPELQWQYGYFGVIILALVIVIAEIIYFKKKKFF